MSARIHTIPGLPTNFSQVIQDNVEEALSGAKGEIVVKVFGPQLAILEDLAGRVVDTLNTVRGATDVGALKIGGQSEVDIELDRQRLARFGYQRQRRKRGGANGAGGVGGQRVLRWRAPLRRHGPDRGAVPRRGGRYRRPADRAAGRGNAGGPGTVSLSEIARIEVGRAPRASRASRAGAPVAIKANLRGPRSGQLRRRGACRKSPLRSIFPPAIS